MNLKTTKKTGVKYFPHINVKPLTSLGGYVTQWVHQFVDEDRGLHHFIYGIRDKHWLRPHKNTRGKHHRVSIMWYNESEKTIYTLKFKTEKQALDWFYGIKKQYKPARFFQQTR